MNYSFIRKSKYEETEKQQLSRIKKLSKDKFISIDMNIKDDSLRKIIPSLEYGDIILCDDVSALGNTMEKLIESIGLMKENNISIHSTCGISIVFKSYQEIDFLNLFLQMNTKLKAQKIKDMINIKRIEGTPLGRPKGSNSKTSKLDRHRKEIEKLLKNKVSVTAIGRRLNTHRITVTTYIERNGLKNN